MILLRTILGPESSSIATGVAHAGTGADDGRSHLSSAVCQSPPSPSIAFLSKLRDTSDKFGIEGDWALWHVRSREKGPMMETGNLVVDPLAKIQRLRFVDLTRAGKLEKISPLHGCRGGYRTGYGEDLSAPSPSNLPSSPDSQNFLGAGNTAIGFALSTGERNAKVARKGTERRNAEQVNKEGKRGSSSPLRTSPPSRKVELGSIPVAVPDSPFVYIARPILVSIITNNDSRERESREESFVVSSSRTPPLVGPTVPIVVTNNTNKTTLAGDFDG